MSGLRVAAKTVFAAVDLVLPRLRGPRILIYHQVGSGRTHEMNVTTEAFRRQLDWMQSHGEIVSLEEAVKRRGEPNADRLFVLTFDDGYRDVFVNAFPLMSAERIPFTLYLTSGPIENPEQFPAWPGDPLTWHQVGSMIDSGLVTVGAHTHTHPDLRHLTESAVVEELERSNELIAKQAGVVPEHFTYPKGWWSASADEEVRARYITATLGGGTGDTASPDLYRMNRLPIQLSDGGPLFRRTIRTGSRTMSKVRRYVHAYDGPS
jgi:peptidoglycan/xylan/chitin deacetylase (PgdA/CDA1 family)